MTERRITPILLNLISYYEKNQSMGVQVVLDLDSYFEISKYYQAEGLTSKAIEVLERAFTHHPHKCSLYKELINLNLKAQEWLKAENWINKAELEFPFKSEILLLKAKLLAGKGEWDQASQIIEDLKKYSQEEEQFNILLTESEISEKFGNFEQMFQSLKKALIINPTDQDALKRLLRAVHFNKHFEESIFIHSLIIENHPYNPMAWYNLGHSYAQTYEYNLAIDAIEYAFLIDPDFEQAYLDCAELCIEQLDYSRAEIILTEAIAIFDSNYDLLIALANCQYNNKKIEEAKRSLFSAMQLEPYCEELHFLLAKCYIEDKDWLSAIKMLESAIDLENGIEEYYFYLGKIYEKIENLKSAEIYLRKAALNGQEQSFFWEELILFYVKNKKWDKTEKFIKLSSKYTYSSTIQYLQIAYNLLHKDRNKAIKEFAEHIKDEEEGLELFWSLDPSFKNDKELLSIANYFRPSNI